MLKEFHSIFDHPKVHSLELRPVLIREEAEELIQSLSHYTSIHGHPQAKGQVAKECADLVYVTFGTAILWDIDLNAVLTEVHNSNLTKFDLEGIPQIRADGKILKGPNYRRPDMSKIIPNAEQIE